MKKVPLKQATLGACVDEARQGPVVLTRNGSPVALIVSLAGMDEEQVELGTSDKFWRLIAARRKEPTMTRAELEKAVSNRRRAKKK